MRYALTLFAVFVLLSSAQAQTPSAKGAKKSGAANSVSSPQPTPTPTEKTRFDSAVAIVDPLDRSFALRSFLNDFPESSRTIDAGERLVAARADLANAMLQSGQSAEAVALLKTAVNEAPNPISQKLFSEVILKIPMLLFVNGQRDAAIEIATMIEKVSESDAERLLGLANFFISTENSTDALRLAARAVEIDPASIVGHQILGLAHRLNFDIEKSIGAYKKALELDSESANIKLSLAQLLRAAGKPAEALEAVQAVLAAHADNAAAQTVEVLSLFDLGKKTEAEAAFDRAMKATPGNVALVASVAYWYAANGDGPNAVLHAEEAIDLEPRFVWAHIALGRGLMIQKKHTEAERTLVKARKYGRFPSLEYEIALSRVAGGYYREAAEDLRGVFAVKDGRIETNLGGRINRNAAAFSDLLADERKASIFEPRSADQSDISAQLASLLALDQTVNSPAPDPDAAIAAASRFASGSDAMQLYRQLYAASLLLEKRLAPATSLELTHQAMSRVDDGLAIAEPAVAVMAVELYDARRTALLRDEFVIVPPVPKPTLSAIVRGRIEETAGWALFEQGNYAEAEIRLKRAISVLPNDSAWWRSSMWRLGLTLETTGKDKEALDAYVASYRSQPGSGSKYLAIRSVYLKVHGNADELEKLVGPNPVQIAATASTPDETDISTTFKTAAAEASPVAKSDETNAQTDSSKDGQILPETPQTVPPKSTGEIPEPRAEPIDTKPTPIETAAPIIDKETTPTETAAPPADRLPASVEETPKIKEVVAAGKLDTEPAQPTSTATKSIFDPVIITVPNRNPAKPNPTEPSEPTENPVAVPKDPIEDTQSGSVRPRVIGGVPTPSVEPPCTINVSQSNVSLVNAEGSVAVLVGTGADSDTKTLTARSSSPSDIEVIAEPEIEGISGRSLYLIRSKSSRTGVFQVTFQSTCGKKEVIVRVR